MLVTTLNDTSALLNGTASLLKGYGAFGHPLPADFNANTLSLVDRGFV